MKIIKDINKEIFIVLIYYSYSTTLINLILLFILFSCYYLISLKLIYKCFVVIRRLSLNLRK
jgi:hypothetical protein